MAGVAILLFAGAAVACRSTTFDLTDLKTPVVLNGNPFVGRTVATAGGVDVGSYEARSEHCLQFGGRLGTRVVSDQDDIQSAAIARIGGHRRRAIRNVALSMEYGFNMFMEWSTTVATGKVVDFPFR